MFKKLNKIINMYFIIIIININITYFIHIYFIYPMVILCTSTTFSANV